MADAPRTLKPIDDKTSHSPFPHDAGALGNMRPDQVPRFFGVLTDPSTLETKTMRLGSLTAMQNRVDHYKVDAMRGKKFTDKPPVVIGMNGRYYIADGHHRLAAKWMDGHATAEVKFKDLNPKDNAVKSASEQEVSVIGIFKTDDEQRMAYGWASVITENGETVVDTQGDVIEPDELMKSTTDFMMNARMAMAMHERNADNQIEDSMRKGVVVHSLPLTDEIAKALGITSPREGWIVGVKVQDDHTWGLVKSGVLKAFSIGARAVREDIGDMPISKRVMPEPATIGPDIVKTELETAGSGQAAIQGGIHLNISLPNITMPAIKMEMPAIDLPDVNVAAPNVQIDVHQPEPVKKSTVTTVLEHDDKGRILKTKTEDA